MHQAFEPLFVQYCTYFNGNADYFECHEVLEELWKDVAPGEKEHVLVGFIQVATALYHWRRNNMKGAQKSLVSAISIVEQQQDAPYFDVIDAQHFLLHVRNALQQIEMGAAFQAFHLQLKDASFAALVAANSKALAPLDAHYITHKHTLRDRSEVIALRAERLANKKR